MILKIPSDMRRVDAATFGWFVKKLDKPTVKDYSNGKAWFDRETMVAATLGDHHYIKVKR